jgi:dipeptidyl aminopeptidase/acylaminoacyl peptidase
VYEYDWSPDSSRLAYTAAKGSGDNNWWIAQLYTVNVSAGAVTQVYRPELQIACPKWSPDGSKIAFISGIMSDEGSTGGDIFVVPAAGGVPAQNLTPDRRSSPSWIRWMPSGKILFTETVFGGSAIASLDPSTRVAETLWKGNETIKAGDDAVAASADGKTIATVRSSWTLAPEVWAGPVGEWKQATHANDALKPMWGKAESMTWFSDDTGVQGWLLYPVNYDPAKTYPLVVSVHGGPAAAKKPSWPGAFDMTLLSSQGYFVLFPNPRGSLGAGETFTKSNVKDFGQGDLRDILLGVDEAIKKLPVDRARLGIAGWSYGGYMTMWTITQTRRFRAAVAGAGIANWQSYYGENLIDQWMIPYFGSSVYDNPAVYAKSSPINFIRNVTTPTLVAVGDSDAECPAPQSYEFWHALKTRGVKTQLVVYPNEGHSIRKPEHVQDLLERTIGWFNENLAAKPAK